MNCFYHPTTVAVGICKSCSKGLCAHCAVDLGKGLACKGRCEQDAADVIGLIDRNIKLAPASEQLIRNASANRYVGIGFNLVIGLLFLGFGFYESLASGFESYDIIPCGLGATFLIYGATVLFRTIRSASPKR